MKINDRTPIAKPSQVSVQQWEYRCKLMDRDADLEQYGSEGWECYSVTPQPADMAMFYFRRMR